MPKYKYPMGLEMIFRFYKQLKFNLFLKFHSTVLWEFKKKHINFEFKYFAINSTV